MERILSGDYQFLGRRHGLLTMGHYDEHLRDYLEVFDRDQLLVLIFEEQIVEAPAKGLERACRFLDLDPTEIPDEKQSARHVHSFTKPRAYLNYWLQAPLPLTRPVDFFFSPWKRSPSPETRVRLRDHYVPHQERLYDLLGRRIESWDTGTTAR
jgi:hypothetical protein